MKKVLAVLLIAMLAFSLVACGGNNTGATADVITINLAEEPKTIDPALNSSVDGGTYLAHTFEGLTTIDKNLQVAPGVAESWTVSEDGTVYTFNLRKDAKWSDGEPVTAKDFVYAWKRLIDPATAAEYAYQAFNIKNASKINAGETADLGLAMPDDYTLVVTLEGPCPYFLSLVNFPALYPVREDIVTANPETWTNDPSTFIGNGPFKITEWAHDSYIYMAKNENYWNASTISNVDLKFVLMADENTIYASFKTGELMFADTLPATELANAEAEGILVKKDQLGTYYFSINAKSGPPFDNPNVRRALSLGIDRQFLVDTVWQDGRSPAGGFVPRGVPDADGSDFRANGGNFINPEAADLAANIAEAKALLAAAGFPDGKGFPVIKFITNDTQGHIDIAEAVQQQWEKNLGIKMEISKQEWGVFQDTRTHQDDWNVARDGWIGDYVDPNTFLDLFMSTSIQQNCRYNNPEFDKLINASKVESDPAKRMQILHDAEKLLVGTDNALIPLTFYSDVYLLTPNLKNVIYSPLGFKYFYWVSLEKATT